LPSANHKLGIGRTAKAEAVSPIRHGNTILLVEDDDIMRSLTRKMLEEHGYTVVEASDGQAAFEWVQANPIQIDLLLTDVVMRRVTGPELADRLAASHPSVKVIFMSGYTGEMMANRPGLKSGITFLEKPFDRTTLLNTIHSTLS
jgi:DNA-binding NtrC family response regulator